MQAEGMCSRASSHRNEGYSVLNGVRADEHEEVVYPDDYCAACLAEGSENERCFHRHWTRKYETTEAYQEGHEIR